MMFHNMLKAPLSDLSVRQAIDLAIDRNALSQALSGGVGTRSLFPDYTPYYSDDSDANGDSRGDASAAAAQSAGRRDEGCAHPTNAGSKTSH